MDRPIYLEFMVREDEQVRNRWYVIEERGGEEETAADELEGWVRKSETDRVRQLHLPHLDYELQFNSLAVAESRLFLIGGYFQPYDTSDPELFGRSEAVGFHYIDLNRSDPTWQFTMLDEAYNFAGAKVGAISKDGWMYTVGKHLGRFRWDDFSTWENFCLPFNPSDAKVLAVTETEVYLFCPSFGGGGSIVRGDLKSNCWKTLNLNSPCSHWSSGVVLGNNYLVSFGVLERNSRQCLDYLPGVYIYDIHNETWLSEPVQGLPYDGIILPTRGLREDGESVFHSSLMQVRRDELKLALVWSHEVPGEQTQVHWSKFILHSNKNHGAPDFYAELLSHGVCFGGDTLLLNSTTG
ncbi:hypothetical protein ABKV19_008222 [Rosa sericea]